jgi:phospholipase/carboxylesterase
MAVSNLIKGDASLRTRNLRQDNNSPEQGRIVLAPPKYLSTKGETGLKQLGIDSRRDALLYIPGEYTPERSIPLAVMLHGAGGDAHHGLDLLRNFADREGFMILAPPSRKQSWDIISDRHYGPDVSFITQALDLVFSRFAVDPEKIALGGFSDGASYALSLGLTNGDLFTHIIAFSPGFMAPNGYVGRPRLFISHGTSDAVLPISMCSRKIVPLVKQLGYDVLYREFKGPHTVPPAIASESVDWFKEGTRR